MHSPNENHMEVMCQILRYLKGALGRGLFFNKSEERSVEAFTDANSAGSVKDKRSTTGYYTFVWGNLVTWRTKIQTVVAKSSAETEFRALTHGIYELLWLKILLDKLTFMKNEPMKVYCDNNRHL